MGVRRFGERGEGEWAREREAAGPPPPRAALEEGTALFCGKSGGGYRFCHPEVERRGAEAAGRDRL
ncbi:MAG: hypothetical protein J5I35_11420 [Methanothrix harundinacea]|nr:hypothetical protein [Methanothrix harundinacea]